MFDTLRTWAEANAGLLVGVGIGSFVLLIVGLLLLPVVVVRLPADTFVDRPAPPAHPVMRVLKNVLGSVLVLAGVAMLVLPGQGILTILIGLALVDFPGKRRLELGIVRRPIIRRTIDRMRARRGVPPLIVPEKGADGA